MPQEMPTMPQDTNMQDDMGGEDMMDGENGMNLDNGDELDPKKEIQQLTGKLSQELRKYNNDQSEPDTELNKYVAGMIIPQSTKVLDGDDKEEIITKINKGETSDEDDMNQDVDSENDDIGDEMQDNSQDNMQQFESKMNIDNVVTEIINSVIDTKRKDDKKRFDKPIGKIQTMTKNPFISNR